MNQENCSKECTASTLKEEKPFDKIKDLDD